MTNALINHELLTWSRERSGMTPEIIARKMKVQPEKIYGWEDGSIGISFSQAEKWSAITHIPFGYLFLDRPPKIETQIPDLRTLNNKKLSTLSIDLEETINDALLKQDWYREYCLSNGQEPLAFIGKYSLKNQPKEVANYLYTLLQTSSTEVKTVPKDEYLRFLTDRAENAGIIVLRSGIVGNNTRRVLSTEEFRGFAISDVYAPLIFVNITDTENAKVFTLVHELAHILIGESGISDLSIDNSIKEEVFCNAVAGEFLMPEADIRAIWSDDIEWREIIHQVSSNFKVSTLAACRRLYDLKFISKNEFNKFYEEFRESYEKRRNSGGDFYRNAAVKNSKKLTKAVLSEAFSGRMLLRDAAKILKVQPTQLKTLYSKLV